MDEALALWNGAKGAGLGKILATLDAPNLQRLADVLRLLAAGSVEKMDAWLDEIGV